MPLFDTSLTTRLLDAQRELMGELKAIRGVLEEIRDELAPSSGNSANYRKAKSKKVNSLAQRPTTGKGTGPSGKEA